MSHAYDVGKCYLGLRSNQRSESLNSRLHVNLDRKMTLFELVEHFDHCLSKLRINEAILDFVASSSLPCLDPNASIIEKEAEKSFTPNVFSTMQFSLKAATECFAREIEGVGYDTIKYIVGREDKGDI